MACQCEDVQDESVILVTFLQCILSQAYNNAVI